MSIRKLAHYGLFMLGGWIVYLTLNCFFVKHKALIAIFLGMLLAFLDEFHQFYSLDRGPGLFDVGLDTLGVISGVFLAILYTKIIKKGKKVYDKLQKNNRRQNCKNS